MSRTTRWFDVPERGSARAMWLAGMIYRYIGRTALRLLLYPIISYFYLTARDARRASLEYLQRLHADSNEAGPLPGQAAVFRHMLSFGINTLDRVGFWLGRRDDFTLRIHGWDRLESVATEGQGTLLIGAHIGSFDVMRLAADRHSPLRVHFLTDTSNAPQINALLQTLDPTGEESKVSVLPVHSGKIGHALRIRSYIKRGEVVAMLADRCHPNERERSTEVDFLGARASLPTGPIALAGTLRCPVLFMVAIRTGAQRYDIHVEEFAERVTLPRGQRDETIQKYCQQYADRLAAYCHEGPDQWFNFYDFWSRKGPHGNG